jgi:hypothetical protein
VGERPHRALRGASRQSREKRQRRNEAGVGTRDEERLERQARTVASAEARAEAAARIRTSAASSAETRAMSRHRLGQRRGQRRGSRRGGSGPSESERPGRGRGQCWVGRPFREVDSRGWERQRGEQAHRRMDAEDGQGSFTCSDSADSKANEVLEGERKARSVGMSVRFVPAAARRKTPGSKPKGKRA